MMCFFIVQHIVLTKRSQTFYRNKEAVSEPIVVMQALCGLYRASLRGFEQAWARLRARTFHFMQYEQRFIDSQYP
jgi:hypothetical protein